MGADGKALPGADGAPYRVNLAEKLLVLVLARLFNYIPEAGLWMNTQRPEWNDANNALVGSGVSMVTLYFLRRFLSSCAELFTQEGAESVEVSAEVTELLAEVTTALQLDADRRTVLDALGGAGRYVIGAVSTRTGSVVDRLWFASGSSAISAVSRCTMFTAPSVPTAARTGCITRTT